MTIKEREKIELRKIYLDEKMKAEEKCLKPMRYISDVREVLKKYIPEEKLSSVLVDIISYGNYQETLTAWIELDRVLKG